MQRLVLIACAAAVLVAPAAAATVDPRSLVLQQADVPRGFQLDREDSGVRSNAAESAGQPEVRALFARSGRLTGYEIAYGRGGTRIEARADVFRSAAGARTLFEWYNRELPKAGLRGLRSSAIRVGAAGRLYSGSTGSPFNLVVWRYDRVFAGVVGLGVTRARTIALARVQQRRISAALG
jgi:hypothetical protein